VSGKHDERTLLLKTRQGKRWTEKDPTMQLNCSDKEKKVLRQVWPFSFSAVSCAFFLWAFGGWQGGVMVDTGAKSPGRNHGDKHDAERAGAET